MTTLKQQLKSILLLFSFFNAYIIVNSLMDNPSCLNCKWFIPNKMGIDDYGLCRMHSNVYKMPNNMEFTVYEFAKHCRDNQNMCSKYGYLYEDKNDGFEVEKYVFTHFVKKEEKKDINNKMYNDKTNNDKTNINNNNYYYPKDEDTKNILRLISKFNKHNFYRS
jgi:hypothetical protein